MRKIIIALALIAPFAAAHADPDGGKVFQQSCALCHSAHKNEKLVGPSLFGVVGRPAGAVDDFRYSDAAKNSHVVWDDASLNTFLSSPKKALPGTRMASFPGVKNVDDRIALIDYLSSLHE